MKLVHLPSLPRSGVIPPPDQSPALVYVASLTTAPSKRTMQSALRVVAGLLGFDDPQQVPWGRLRFPHVAAVQAKLTEPDETGRPRSPITARHRMAALKGVLHAAWKLGQMSAENYQQAIDIKPPKGRRTVRGRCLSDEEMQKLFAVVAEPSLRNARDAAILMLLCFGLRRSEVVGLDLSCYDRNTGRLTFIGKGNAERIVHLPRKSAQPAVERWLHYRGTEPGPLILPIDVRGRAHMRRCSEKVIPDTLSALQTAAGIDGFAAHDLRRTMISELLDRGSDIATIARVVGHKDVKVTAQYDRRGERSEQALTEGYNPPFQSKEEPKK